MRHRKKGRKLNRTWSHRKAMLRNMVTTFLREGQIETTDAKAKEVRSLAEKLVTVAKRGDTVAARRHVLKVVRDKKVVAKLFSEIAPRYADRPGGYTRIVKMENRRGDNAPLSMLQFVMEPVTFKERKPRPDEDDGFAPDEEPKAAATEPEPEETAAEGAEEPAETPSGDEADQEPEAEKEKAGESDAGDEGEAEEGTAADEPAEAEEKPADEEPETDEEEKKE